MLVPSMTGIVKTKIDYYYTFRKKIIPIQISHNKNLIICSRNLNVFSFEYI